MSKRSNSRKASRRHSLTRGRKRLNLYRRKLRHEPLEDRRMLAVVTVTTLADTIDFNDGQTSLREAIFATNTVPGADAINFAPSLTANGPASIVLAQGQLTITDALTITGPGAGLLTIDATGSDTNLAFLDGKGSRIFNVDDGTANLINVSIGGLRLTGADSNASGGAIFNRENLNLEHVKIEKNFSLANSGAIAHLDGTLRLFDTLVVQNSHSNGSTAGVVSASNGTVIIDSSTFSSNGTVANGVLSASNTNLTITHSTFSGNPGAQAIRVSGGVLNIDNSQITGSLGGIITANTTATIVDSTISNNTQYMGGITASGGSLTISRTTITGNKSNLTNRGGGVTAINATVSIVDSQISNNTARSGAGIYLSGGQAEIMHSTFVDNFLSDTSINDVGIGIRATLTDLDVVDCTITGNTGGLGYAVFATGSASVPVVIKDSTISSNYGGILISSNGGSATVDDVVIAGNTGRGIYSSPTNGGSTTITNSHVVNNHGAGVSLHMTSGTTTSILRSEISGNTSFFPGAGVYALGGSLAIDDSDIHDNVCTGTGGGGIQANTTPTTITNSRIFNNSTQGYGGGIYAKGRLTITGSDISNNVAKRSGGGIRADVRLILDTTRIANNTASAGGGVYAAIVSSQTPHTIAHSEIIGNTATGASSNVVWSGAGGGIICFGNMLISDTTIDSNVAQNRGGGAFISTGGTIERSTISNNSGLQGGGLFGGATISESTISGNTAQLGGGAYLYSSKIDHTTIAFNQASNTGGGFYVRSGALSLDHSIVAQNAGASPDIGLAAAGTLSAMYSLIGTNSGSGLSESPVGHADANGNLVGGPVGGAIDPLLGPLADNGGPTQTHALLAGSPAINAGDLSAVSGAGGVPLYDQRGEPYSRVFNGRIDIGAFEYQQPSDLNLVVDTLSDESDGNYSHGNLSLREAVALANAYPSNDTIRFDPALTAGGPATILLSHGQLAITDALTIIGPGASLLTIDASGNDPTPAVKDGKGSCIFNVDNGTSVVIDVGISGLTLRGGDVTGDGGAISSSENLRVTDSTISNSAATGGGGGVFSQIGTLFLSGSTLTGNSTKSGSMTVGGGGAVASLGSATIDHSTLSGNSAFRGGAIRAFGDLLVDHSTISGNTAQTIGGGICSYGTSAAPNSATIRDSLIANNVATSGEGGGVRQRYGSLLIERTTITGNKAIFGGGISAADSNIHVEIVDSAITANVLTGIGASTGYGGGVFLKTATASVVRSTISGNSGGRMGGGIYLQFGGLTIESSTVSGNFAAQGGGIASSSGFSSATATVITNSTISGNTASTAGGGIRNFSGLMSIRYSTITNNSAPEGAGSGIIASGGSFAPTEVGSSIIAGNVHSDVVATSANSFTSLGYNLIGTGTHLEAFNKPGDQTGVSNPMLGPLTNNGGPTMTHALLVGSPAIDAGDPAAALGAGGVPLTDQRGVPFIRVYGGRIDIGAFESQPTDFILGDFNHDGAVDSSDYTLLRKQDGQTVPPGTGADANGDGIVNSADYLVWKTNLGVLQPPKVFAKSPAIGLSGPMSASSSAQQVTLSQNKSGDDSNLPSASQHTVIPWSTSRVSGPRRGRTLWSADGPQYTTNTRWSDLALEGWCATGPVDQRSFGVAGSESSTANDSAYGSASASLKSAIDTAFATL